MQENLRVSKNLYKTEKATIDVVYRAEAELSRLQQQRAEADKMVVMTRSFFNFLLNRPLDTESEVNEPAAVDELPSPILENGQISAIAHREELAQLKLAIEAQRNGVKLQRSNFLPGVSVVFDYGYQGEEYRFTDKDDD